MGQIAYRANLSAATFPMTLADGGRTVIVPGPDQNFDRRVDPTGEQKEAGIPQALYLENVIPTSYGYQSVGYVRHTAPVAVSGSYIFGVFPVYAVAGDVAYKNFVFSSDTGSYRCGQFGTNLITYVGTPMATGDILSSAYVRGTAYVFAEGSDQIYEVLGNTGALQFTNVTASVTPLNFFNTSGIKQIISFANYLIAISFSGRVYWSSLTTALDFVSSLVSGSGSIIPNDLVGRVTDVTLCSGGFYIYTTQNSVYVQYTGNARYPFKFTVVKDSQGAPLLFPLLIKSTAGSTENSANVVAEPTRAIKYIEKDLARDIGDDISDFLKNTSTQALLDYTTNTLTQQSVNTKYPLVHIWQSRHVFISINDAVGDLTSQYTHVIVYDTLTNRTGKLKVRHKFIILSDLYGAGFVESDQKLIRWINLDIYNVRPPFTPNIQETAEAALLLGKFQYVRSRMMRMEEIEIEGPQNTAIVPSPNFSVFLLPSQDGRNFNSPVALSDPTISGGLATYTCHHTAKNHSLLIKGVFSINTVQLRFVPGGDR